MTLHEFPFYTTDMWDYDFQMEFAQWLHKNKKATRTCCLVGIRTQESHNRWRAITEKQRNDMPTTYGVPKLLKVFITSILFLTGKQLISG